MLHPVLHKTALTASNMCIEARKGKRFHFYIKSNLIIGNFCDSAQNKQPRIALQAPTTPALGK